ncbi:MAG: MmgE/PrpD family protein [Candidatus Margulisbacteria bacterium]|nr:MmgE/PrpD family protein [Candidatus Margulisiibacteriota bacterium]
MDVAPTNLEQEQMLIGFVSDLTINSLPSNIVHQAKRTILEGISWFYMGLKRENLSPLSEFITSVSSAKKASVINCGQKVEACWAAYAHAALAQAMECSDGMRVASVRGGAFHPGRLIIPVALAMAESLACDGKALITSVVGAYEIAARIQGLAPRPRSAVYGASFAASKLMGLDANM